MKETVLANREDAYLLDPDRSARVKEWMSSVSHVLEAKDLLNGSPTDVEDVKLSTFCDAFPQDMTVQTYQKTPTATCKADLLFHISVIESSLPVKAYMTHHGLSSSYLIQKLKEKIESDDDKVSLKAIETGLKLMYPDEKPIRVPSRATQININTEDEAQKNALIERILQKVE